jgi:hypothetical protein
VRKWGDIQFQNIILEHCSIPIVLAILCVHTDTDRQADICGIGGYFRLKKSRTDYYVSIMKYLCYLNGCARS